PNNALAQQYRGYVYRRRGEWERSLAELQRAEELDPRDSSIPANVGVTYLALRLWKNAEQAELRALAIDPHSTLAATFLVNSRLRGTGDIDSARRAFNGFPEDVKSRLFSPLFRGGQGAGGVFGAIISTAVYLDVIERHFHDAFQDLEKQIINNDR